MSDTMDECRAHVAEQRHERGDCEAMCSFCDEEPLVCSCGRPAEVDIHCKNCFYEGAYSGHMIFIMGPDPEPQRVGMRWPTDAQIHEAERRAEADLAAMIEAEKRYSK